MDDERISQKSVQKRNSLRIDFRGARVENVKWRIVRASPGKPMKSFSFPLVFLISVFVAGCASSQQPTPAQRWLDQQEALESDDIQLDRIP